MTGCDLELLVAKEHPDFKITSPAIARAEAGKPFTFVVQARGGFATITATGSPSWLKSADGLLSATSPVQGSDHFTVTAANDTGSVNQKFTLVVSAD
jgi:hypothetical protein